MDACSRAAWMLDVGMSSSPMRTRLHLLLLSYCKLQFSALATVLPFQPKNRRGRVENYLFLLSKRMFTGLECPKKTFYLILKMEALFGNLTFNVILSFVCENTGRAANMLTTWLSTETVSMSNLRLSLLPSRGGPSHGEEQHKGDLHVVFYGFHLQVSYVERSQTVKRACSV